MVLDVVSLPAAMRTLALELSSPCVNLQGLSESSASRWRKMSLREEPSFLAGCEQSFTSKTEGADVGRFGEIDDELG